jgi:hypothetical protein
LPVLDPKHATFVRVTRLTVIVGHATTQFINPVSLFSTNSLPAASRTLMGNVPGTDTVAPAPNEVHVVSGKPVQIGGKQTPNGHALQFVVGAPRSHEYGPVPPETVYSSFD